MIGADHEMRGCFGGSWDGAVLGRAWCSAGAAAPRGRPSMQMVTQLSPSIPQYLRVDIPMLRDGIPQKSGGRIQVTLASWPERGLTGPELLRVLRAGQIDLGGIALPTVAGDAPLLDIIDLAGLLTSHELGRGFSEAVMPGSIGTRTVCVRIIAPIRSRRRCSFAAIQSPALPT